MKLPNYKYLSSWNPRDTKSLPTIVVTCFLQKKDKILALQRARKDIQHNLWGIPGGKLENEEDPIHGLVREIKEETGSSLNPNVFQLLATACSLTQCDGKYGLYLFHAFVPDNFSVTIDPQEHHSFRWVTLTEFQSLELLTAQGEAFTLIKDKLQTFSAVQNKLTKGV